VTKGAVSSPNSSGDVKTARFNTALVLLAACAVGVFADRGALLAEPWSAFAEIGTPFVLVAFVAGRQLSGFALGVLWGAAVLSLGQGAYYAWLFLAQEVGWGTLTYQYRAGAWLIAGGLVGALAGALGSASRATRSGLSQTLGWGLLVAVPLAEAVWVARWQPPPVSAGVALLVMAVALYLWAVLRDRAPWQLGVVSALAFAPGVLLAENFRHLV
jgi:hypothetical protein